MGNTVSWERIIIYLDKRRDVCSHSNNVPATNTGIYTMHNGNNGSERSVISTDVAPSEFKPFPLNKLPGELRNLTYQFAFPSDELIFMDEQLNFGAKDNWSWHIYVESLAKGCRLCLTRPVKCRGTCYSSMVSCKSACGGVNLLRVNHQIRKEAFPVLLKQNTVAVRQSKLKRFLDSFGIDMTMPRLDLRNCFWSLEGLGDYLAIEKANFDIKVELERTYKARCRNFTNIIDEYTPHIGPTFQPDECLLPALLRRARTRYLKVDAGYEMETRHFASESDAGRCSIEDFIAQSRFQELMQIRGLHACEIAYWDICDHNTRKELFNQLVLKIQSVVTQEA